MTAPLISVVMPSYKGAALIRETIDSVRAQTVQDFEIIVIDDGSPDHTVALVESLGDPRIRVVRAPENGGPARARSLGAPLARGRYIAGLDQDDLCHPTRFAKQVAWLEAHPEAVLLASTIAPFGPQAGADPFPALTDPDAIDWQLLVANPLAWSSVMMRAEPALRLQPFQRDARRYAEDFDFYHRIRAFGRIGRLAEPLVRYRLHAGGSSRLFEERMILAAGAVLAERYAADFGAEAAAAGVLMSRHAAAAHAPPDAATLAACGAVLDRLLATQGAIAPDYAPGAAAATWWAIARRGLRAGAYGPRALRAACPGFARARAAAPPVRDAVIGAARRIVRRLRV
ncbi:glycosyltransferase family 2 protein [Sphingomonas morindae]|uniref:Glycosyltransferase n=1 Tax=Sphingomonas morindae TaxID=1541170 RepID=A0ABY4XBV6_9SPHN|nr:glycosyltransferase family 2 protein [Sphingomonas morindae]USI74180.1 glycosyltransferase [Sphingomonas morindae]